MGGRTFDQLASEYSPEVRALARRTRAFVRTLLPKADERVDSSGPYVSYGHGPGYKGIVCYMTIGRGGVKLGVAEGASIADPRRLLQGSGKRHRHVPLRRVDDLARPGLRELVRAAEAAWHERQSAAAKTRRPRRKAAPLRAAGR